MPEDTSEKTAKPKPAPAKPKPAAAKPKPAAPQPESAAPEPRPATAASKAKVSQANAAAAKTAKTAKTAKSAKPGSEPTPQAAAVQATANAPSSPETPPGENQLHKKLGLRPTGTGVVIAPPEDSDNPLLPLPANISVLAQLDDLAGLEGSLDFILVFARDRAALAGAFSALRDKLAPGGSLWVAWMKQSASRGGGGLFGDLNETLIRRLALTHALVDVKVAALDRLWAALRLVHRRH